MLLTLTLLPLLALASPLQKRDGASIVAAIGEVANNLTATQSALDGFTSGNDTFAALNIELKAGALSKSLDSATSVCNSSAPLSDAESGDVANSVVGLQPKVYKLLDTLVEKKPLFETVLLGYSAVPLVRNDLVKAKGATSDFGNALIPKLSANFQMAAPIVVKQFDDKFEMTLAAYS